MMVGVLVLTVPCRDSKAERMMNHCLSLGKTLSGSRV